MFGEGWRPGKYIVSEGVEKSGWGERPKWTIKCNGELVDVCWQPESISKIIAKHKHKDRNGKACAECGNTYFRVSGDCDYCCWKGTVGPGAQLKKQIKEYNDRL